MNELICLDELILFCNQCQSFEIWSLTEGAWRARECLHVCSGKSDSPSHPKYGSGMAIKHSSERINVYGQGFLSHTANTVWAQTNCSYSSCPLMSFCKFILTWELKMKWKPTAFIIIVLSPSTPLSLSFSSTVVWFVSPHSLNSDSPPPEPTGIFLYPNHTLNMCYVKQMPLWCHQPPIKLRC